MSRSADWAAQVERFGRTCAYCGASGPLGRDHVIPRSRGGSDDIANLVPACTRCNSSKHDSITGWLPRLMTQSEHDGLRQNAARREAELRARAEQRLAMLR